MTRGHRPFSRCSHGSILTGLMAVLQDRGVEAQWHDRRHRDHLMALVGGDDGLEVHAFLGNKRFRKIGRMLLIEAVHQAFISPEAAQQVAFFCDRANATLYASKLYLRQAPGDPSVFQVVAERACLFGVGDLTRLADEFDLLVTEYMTVEERLTDLIEEESPVIQARQFGLFREPAAESC